MPIGFQGVDRPGKHPIGWGCPIGAKYEQTATLLRQGAASTAPVINPPTPEQAGEGVWHTVGYHELTGEPIREWVPIPVDTGMPDDPTTPADESRSVFTFSCQARSVITGGLNSQGTTERFTSKGTYQAVDFVELHIPLNVTVTTRDRITNIKDSSGNIIWLEEQRTGVIKPTVFDVLGVAPMIDPFGSQTEWFALLRRAGVQGEGASND